MHRLALSPRTFTRVTLVAVGLLAFIVVTGGAVRLTGSGLGCPDWPTCAAGHVIAPPEYHAMVEFVNRVVTALVSITVIGAVLGSLVRVPRRTDLVVLSVGLVAGVIGQIVLGGLVVLFHLFPPLVMGHFVLSMLLLLDATVLHHRSRRPDGERRLVVPSERATHARLLVALAAIVLFMGTVVTGAGPHAGSNNGQLVQRLPFAITDVARLHSIAVWLFLGWTVFVVRSLRVDRAPAAVQRRAEVLVALIVAQGGLGYLQYFTGVPPILVGLHIAGATAVWIATIELALSLTTTSAGVNLAATAALTPA